MNLQIINNTNENITIHDRFSNVYQGYYLKPNDSYNVMICDTTQSLIARSTIGETEAILTEIESEWIINNLVPAFSVIMNNSNIEDGDILSTSDVSIDWNIGSDNKDVIIQLANSNFDQYNLVTTYNPPITSIDYEMLDDTDEGEFYTFRINSTKSDGVELYGWTELNFGIDAVGQNGLRIFPMQSTINRDSTNQYTTDYEIEIIMEDLIDTIASVYLEIEFDESIFNIDFDNITKVDLFENCNDGVLLFNDEANQSGVLKITALALNDNWVNYFTERVLSKYCFFNR